MPNQAPNAVPGDAQALGRLGGNCRRRWAKAPPGPTCASLSPESMKGVSSSPVSASSNAGKSTLLDALVGEQILPTGVVPVTTVPTVLRYGSQRTARVLIDGKWKTIRPEDLSQYVSEELNPENKKRVEGVEAFLPSPLLASGMCLVDTPWHRLGLRGKYRNHQGFHPAD